MEMYGNYYWETEFITAENMAVYTFSDRVKVISNFKTGMVKVIKDGIVIRELEGREISDFEKLLLEVGQDAKTLKSFEYDTGIVSH